MFGKAKAAVSSMAKKAEANAQALSNPLTPELDLKISRIEGERDAIVTFTAEDKLGDVIPPTFKKMLRRICGAKKVMMNELELAALHLPDASKSGEHDIMWIMFDFTGNKIVDGTLPAEIANLFNLQELRISACNLTRLPIEIGALENLLRFHVDENKLTTLPIEMRKMKKLRELNASDNKLSDIPRDVLANLRSIEVLNLRENQLYSFTGVADLPQFVVLDLSQNQFEQFPQELSKVSSLKRLNMSNNKLKELPSAMVSMTSLEELNISENPLEKVPDFFSQMAKLTKLDLSSCKLTFIPDSLCSASQVTTLNLSSNSLVTLPASIVNLTSVNNLDLSSNRFTTIPEGICEMTWLYILDLSKNELSDIPVKVGMLTKLTKLSLWNNKLTRLPAEIGHCMMINDLDLSGNKMVFPPESLCLKGTIALLQFCQENILPDFNRIKMEPQFGENNNNSNNNNNNYNSNNSNSYTLTVGTQAAILLTLFDELGHPYEKSAPPPPSSSSSSSSSTTTTTNAFTLDIVNDVADAPKPTGFDVTDRKNGTYMANFRFGFAGSYKVHIFYHQREIKQCPLSIVVAAGAAAANKSVSSSQTLYAGAKVGERVDVLLQLKDKFGNSLTSNSGKSQVSATASNGNDGAALAVELKDNNNGTFSIAFTPSSKGHVLFFLQLDGIHTLGSPFNVPVS